MSIFALAKRLGIAGRIRAAWKVDVDHAAEQLRKELARLARSVDAMAANQQAVFDRAARMEQHANQIKQAFRLNDAQRALILSLDSRLDAAAVVAHVQQSIDAAVMNADPFPHIVVERMLPDDVYKLVLQAIPPVDFFTTKDAVKQDLRIPLEFGPTVATRVWDFIDSVVAREAVRPMLLRKFHEPLQRHYEAIFGPSFRELASQLPQAPSGGRLMLRRPGYFLAPHRDPKRTMFTCLMYLARSKDSEAYGTGVYRVPDDREATYTQTYYPGQDGRACELVKLVPYRPNSALIFLNSGGAHGAEIPADAPPKLERYAYQFYVGPPHDALEALLDQLPPDRRALWRSKGDLAEA